MPLRFEGLKLTVGERVSPWPVEREERTIHDFHGDRVRAGFGSVYYRG